MLKGQALIEIKIGDLVLDHYNLSISLGKRHTLGLLLESILQKPPGVGILLHSCTRLEDLASI